MKLVIIVGLILIGILFFNNYVEAVSAQTYQGTIDNKYTIKMSLRREGSNLSGSYVYLKYNIPLKLNGSIDGSNRITIYGYDRNGTLIDVFNGVLGSGNKFSGSFTRQKDMKVMPFELTTSNPEVAMFGFGLPEIIIIAVILGVIYIAFKKKKKIPLESVEGRESEKDTQKRVDDTYRPSTQRKLKDISFSNIAEANKKINVDLADIKDAYTGAPINLALGVYRCQNCTVYYHRASYEVLREINSSQCVACKSTNITSLTEAQARTSHGSNYSPDIITLQNYRQHVGRVITFEGHVHTVLISKRGKEYAVMFENATWTKGFKLIFLRAAVREIGERYIFSLASKTIMVRGLLVNHPVFGYEIIVSEKSMILKES